MLLVGQDYEFIQGNLCDPAICELAVQGVTSVFHFAASMGDTGTIHADNDLASYTGNITMTLHLLSACLRANAKVQRIFYASSATIDPDELQQIQSDGNVSLCGRDTLRGPLSRGLDGLEKLSVELILHHMSSKIDIRIARFHNVYGPGGAWNNGRENAPAALLRKACELRFIQNEPLILEFWGDGEDRRRFLYIDDAVDAVMRLFVSGSAKRPVNIASDESITTQNLAELALTVYNIERSQVKLVKSEYRTDRPIGVASRNSDNTEIQSGLQWRPTTSILDGMKKTGEWIEKESTLKGLQSKGSRIVPSDANQIIFAILLPITSKGCFDPGTCLENLQLFASSLARTTWKDTRYMGEIRFHAKVYLAIDHEDDHLLSPVMNGSNKVEDILRQNCISDVVTIICDEPRSHICSIWRQCAERAWVEECDYFVLMSDDVVLHDPGWMRDIHHEFQRLAESQHVPFGFGCVAFMDLSFPGMPTFPVVHRTHMDIFNGMIVPESFIDQDGDSFLFQLYRRWGCSSMTPSLLGHGVLDGTREAHDIEQRAKDWTFETLDGAVEKEMQWLQSKQSTAQQMVTLDVVVPCYRVELEILRRILSLKSSDTCSVMFIIIIDDPHSPNTSELERQYSHRPDVRIRRNATNIGAAGSRNRGMEESAADWIAFLDDDIIAQSDLLVEAEKVIREYPTAAGFIGRSMLPQSQNIFTTAVLLCGVAFFFDIATRIEHDIPWGVTANLIARRNIRDGVRYDPSYPKAGGGEDVEFCLRKRKFFLANGLKGFVAAPKVVVTHPWWDNGHRSYRRFYRWAYADGVFLKRFPEDCYWDYCPNSAELLFLSGLVSIVSPFALRLWDSLILAFRMVVAIVLANIIHDYYRHLWKLAKHHNDMNTSLTGWKWVVAIIESTGIRLTRDMGRLHGMMVRGDLVIGRRFDWFAGRLGKGPKNEERIDNLQRAIIAVVVFHHLHS